MRIYNMCLVICIYRMYGELTDIVKVSIISKQSQCVVCFTTGIITLIQLKKRRHQRVHSL